MPVGDGSEEHLLDHSDSESSAGLTALRAVLEIAEKPDRTHARGKTKPPRLLPQTPRLELLLPTSTLRGPTHLQLPHGAHSYGVY